jgi:hypothetical protein
MTKRLMIDPSIHSSIHSSIRSSSPSTHASLRALGLTLALTAAACGGTGLGAATRADIAAQMATTQAPLESCYEAALKTNRKLAGMVVLSFVAAPKTGQFENVTITRDEVRDPAVRRCVVEEVSKLKLEKPQGSRVSISYPIHFAPTK